MATTVRKDSCLGRFWKWWTHYDGWGDLYIYNAKCSQCRNGSEESELEELKAMLEEWVRTDYFPSVIVSPCGCSLKRVNKAAGTGCLGEVLKGADDRTQGQQSPGSLQQPDGACGLPCNAVAEGDGKSQRPAGNRQDTIDELHTRFVLLIAELFEVVENRFNSHACPLCSEKSTR